ncbi:TonB-dependent receptor [Candidatus Desantisbacteria bacterium]|nr:TonB-dependent receptor [Candidatus Desantisbacteria bacterium]
MRRNALLFGLLGIFILFNCFDSEAQMLPAQRIVDEEKMLFIEIPIVTVASRMEERVTDAPGIVKVWTKEEIRKMGIYTIDELACITAGYGIEEADGLHGFEVRGLHGNAFDNQKVLILINGMPINIARNLRAWIGEELPLYFVERVEFLKGPSSALYGNGAVLGVVNIVTCNPQNNEDLLESKISVGWPHEQKRFMGHCLMEKKNISGDICFGFYGKNNSEEIYGENNRVRDGKKNQNLLATFDCTQDSPLNGLKFGVFSISQRGGLGTGWIGTTHKIDDYTFETLQPFLMYNKKLTGKLTLNTKLLFQRNDDIGLFFAGGEDAIKFGLIDHSYMGDIGLRYNSSDRFNISGGVAYDRRRHTNQNSHFYIFSGGSIISGGDYYFNSSKSCMIKSAYLQLQNEFPILQGLRSTLGVRYDKGNNQIEPGNSFSKTSPRIGFVQRVNDCFNVKLLYGSAMRSLGLKESIDNTMYADEYKRKTGTPITFTAKPETIETVETSALYYTKRFQTSITYFNNTMKNPIRAYNVPVGTTTGFVVPYLNVAKEHKTSGIELDFDMNIPDGRFFVNAAICKGKDSDGKEIPNIPKTKFNAGLFYHLPADLDVSLIMKNADYTKRGTTDASVLSKLGDRVDDHTIVDMNCIKKINDSVRLEAKINNLFDSSWYYPQLSDTLSFDHPQPGRVVVVSLDVRL